MVHHQLEQHRGLGLTLADVTVQQPPQSCLVTLLVFLLSKNIEISRRTPVIGQDGETDVAVAVDVRVDWNVFADEDHLG